MYWVGKWSFYPTWLGKGGHYSYDFQPLVHGSRKQQPYQKKFIKRKKVGGIYQAGAGRAEPQPGLQAPVRFSFTFDQLIAISRSL